MSGRRAAPDSEDADLLFLALRGRRVGHRLRGGGEGSWSGSGEGKRARAQRQRGGAWSGERRGRKQLYRGGGANARRTHLIRLGGGGLRGRGLLFQSDHLAVGLAVGGACEARMFARCLNIAMSLGTGCAAALWDAGLDWLGSGQYRASYVERS